MSPIAATDAEAADLGLVEATRHALAVIDLLVGTLPGEADGGWWLVGTDAGWT